MVRYRDPSGVLPGLGRRGISPQVRVSTVSTTGQPYPPGARDAPWRSAGTPTGVPGRLGPRRRRVASTAPGNVPGQDRGAHRAPDPVDLLRYVDPGPPPSGPRAGARGHGHGFGLRPGPAPHAEQRPLADGPRRRRLVGEDEGGPGADS